MSERLRSTLKTSNEDIIDDLTKDLKSTLGTEDNHEGIADIPEIGAEVLHEESIYFPENADSHPDEDYHNGINEEETSDTESIAEVARKDEEIDLTEVELDERRTKAEEYKLAGNDAFKVGDYELSIEEYTKGLRICPLQFSQQRAILYCNRSASMMKLQNYDEVIKDCTRAIEIDNKYLKAYLRRAHSLESNEKYDESLADFKKVLELDSTNKEAATAIDRIPLLIEQKNEHLKTEMMGKLKDLGNMILKPFGLSTNNFQMEQDPDSKGYKINFKQ